MRPHPRPMLADAAATYRRVDLAGRVDTATSAGLVQLLYTEAVAALRAAAHAVAHRRFETKSERITRATAILFALEAGLDHDAGGPVAATLARFYAGARGRIVEASLGQDPAPFLEVAASLDEIAGAWTQARAA
jgi:flagellar secretion chaperone FliS